MKFKKEFIYEGKKFIVIAKKYGFDCYIKYRVYQKQREKKHWFDFSYKTLIINTITTKKPLVQFKKRILKDIDDYYRKLRLEKDFKDWFMNKNSKF